VVAIKGKILFLVLILIVASVTVAAYQVTSSNPQLKQSNVANLQNTVNKDHKDDSQNEISDSDNTMSNQPNSNNIRKSSNKKEITSKSNVKTSDSQSIAQKYIEEPNAVAGKPERYNIGGKPTDVVPVLIDGKRVGEIDIDPETGKNVGGAGGAP